MNIQIIFQNFPIFYIFYREIQLEKLVDRRVFLCNLSYIAFPLNQYRDKLAV